MSGKFWVDADTLMRAKNDHYAFDIAPGFWEIIKRNATAGKLSCPMAVYDEIAKGGDELSKWASPHKSSKLFAEPAKEVQKLFTNIAEYVSANYSPAQVAYFLSGADGWLIASALYEQGIVVTHEVLVGPDSKRVKIPNVCRKFGVQWINCYEMLRRLKESLHEEGRQAAKKG